MPNIAWVDIAPVDYTPVFGEKLITVGYPTVQDLTVTEGLFTGIVESPFFAKEPIWKTTVPVTGGSSGGGFYRASPGGNKIGLGVHNPALEYALVGLATGMDRRTSFQTYISTPTGLDKVFQGLLNTEKAEVTPEEEKKTSTDTIINPADLR